MHKLPIYLAGDPPTLHFVCFADGAGEYETEVFLRDHARLLNRLSAWTLVAIGPASSADFGSTEGAFKRFTAQDNQFLGVKPSELRWYCHTRKAVEAKQLDRIPVTDLTRFRDLRRRLSSPLVDALHEEWLTSGDTALVRYGRRRQPGQASAAPKVARLDRSIVTMYRDRL